MNNSLDTLEENRKKPLSRLLKVGSLFAAAALTLAGCASGTTSTSSGESSTGETSSSEGTAEVNGDGPHIAVIGGAAFDGFWNIVKNGAESAGAALAAQGGKMTWLPLQTYDNLGPDAGDLVRDAIGLEVDAIAVPNWVPEAENEAIMDAIAAGIPVFLYNAGGSEQREITGAIKYIGTDEYKAGYSGGEYFVANGAKNILCINTSPGAVNQETRCQGVADAATAGGAKSSQLPLPSSTFGDASAVAQAVKGALIEDETIDAIITIGAQDCDAAFSGVEQADLVGSVAVGTFDMNENVLKRIQDGTQLFAIDQQPFQQGYMAVSMAWHYVQYGILSPGDFLTGPSLVTAANVAATINGVALGTR
ncbi:substrate-binding domain-containing protein [Aquiluna sp.]|nr:substrate-binding domain-containing protein [Aquiluna sp.]MDA8992860.1 substrate-binding domain-containing protein [Aquiluna sp.]